MATTTNYGWTTPDDTALVKDGAAAIRTLGSSVDTTTKALNPSTTLGDIEYRSSTANTNTRLGIGSTGNVLTVAGGVPTWAAPAASPSGLNLISTTTLSASGSFNLSGIFSSTYKNYLILGSGIVGSTSSYIDFGLRTGSTNATANYAVANFRSTYTTNIQNSWDTGAAQLSFLNLVSGASTALSFVLNLNSPFEASATGYFHQMSYNTSEQKTSGQHQVATSYDSMWFTVISGTVSGSISVYGYGV